MSSDWKQGNVHELVQTLLGTFHRARVIDLKCRLLMKIIDEYSVAFRRLDDRELCILIKMQPLLRRQQFLDAVLFAMSDFEKARQRLAESALTQIENLRELN
jgi:hypothetical protein